MITTFVPALMRNDERINTRNGYRRPDWDTRASAIELAIPKLRSVSYFPIGCSSCWPPLRILSPIRAAAPDAKVRQLVAAVQLAAGLLVVPVCRSLLRRLVLLAACRVAVGCGVVG